MDKERLEGNEPDNRIVERLAERERKLEKIGVWNRNSSRGRYSVYSMIAVAACIALVIVLSPFDAGKGNVMEELGIEHPRFGGFRAASAELVEVERLLDDGKVYEALDMNEGLLKKSDKDIKELENAPMYDDEEWMYEYQSEKLYNGELRWSYIYLLVVVECENTAVKELKKYMKEMEFCTHHDEASRLLKALD